MSSQKNITIYHDNRIHYDFNLLIDEIKSQLGDCSTVHIYKSSIKRSVSIRTHYNMQEFNFASLESIFSVIDFQIISNGIEAERLDINQQILLIALHLNFREEISNELEILQKKGWAVIILCDFVMCPHESWLPVHRIFPFDYWMDNRRYIRRNTITNLINVLKNPLFNRIELAMKIKLKNFDKSCFSKQQGEVVIHLMVHRFDDSITLLRYAIITVSQFPNKEVKFVFYSYSLFFNNGMDFQFLRHFPRNYGINNETISFQRLSWFSLAVIMRIKEHAVSTKRNFFLTFLRVRDHFLEKICSGQVKDIHFYSSSFHDQPLRQCDGKRSPDIHENVDLYNEEHFMNTINDLACEKSNDKKDEL